MAIIGGRVIPFFIERGLGHTKAVKPWGWLDVALLVGSGLIAVLYAAGVASQQNLLLGVLFLAIAAGHLLRLVRWHDAGIWRVPLLWSLHLAMLWLVVAAAGLALWNFGLLDSSSPSLHALSVGSMSCLILAMTASPSAIPGVLWSYRVASLAPSSCSILEPPRGCSSLAIGQ